MIECKDIDYILAISKYNNISKAAEELFISQPALTKYLKNLENRLEVKLFSRSRKNFKLTLAGEVYVTYAKEIATQRNDLEAKLTNLKNNTFQTLQVGFACTGLRKVIYQAVQEVRSINPAIKITLRELTSSSIEAALASYQLDLGFITLPAENALLTTRMIMEEDILLGIPSTHPLSSLGSPCYSKKFPLIDLKRFRNDQFVLRDPRTRFRALTDNMFLKCGFSPEIATTARNHFSCIEFAEAWKMCVLTTESFTKKLQNPESMRFFTAGPIPQKLPLGIAYRKNEPLSLSACQLINTMNRQINMGNRSS